MEKEEWKPVRGFENYAEISNFGQIHRFEREYYTGRNHQIKKVQEEKFTYGSEDKVTGYLRAVIGGVSKGIHVWVYETFNDCAVPKGYDVNHIDENKHNNRLDNLNLMSHGDNIKYGTRNARVADALSKPVQALDKVTGEVVMEFPSTQEAQRQGFNAGAVSKCCRNCYLRPGNNVYKGLIWRFRLPQ